MDAEITRPGLPGPGQRFIGALARRVVWLFYHLDRVGLQLPAGAVLLIANHPNSLLDPALILSTGGRPIRFLAKSTLFKGLPGPLMRLAGAIPVYRRTDAGEDPRRNTEMFAAVADSLAKGEAVCLFPEGTTHSRGRLDPLRTGAARIALSSAAAGVPLDIVPVGINFDRKAVFRSRATVFFGPPFRCDDLLSEYRRDQGAAVRALTARLSERLRLMVVEANPQSAIEAVDRIDSLYCAARGMPTTGEDRVQRRRAIATGIENLRSRNEQQYEAIRQRLQDYDAGLARFRLSDSDLDKRFPPSAARRFAIRETIYAIVLLPLAVLGFSLFAVPYLLTDWLARRPANLEMRATWKVIGGALVYGAWIILLAIGVSAVFGNVAGLIALGALPAFGLIALAAIEREVDVANCIRTYVSVQATPGALKHRLVRRRGELVTLLEQTQQWLDDGP